MNVLESNPWRAARRSLTRLTLLATLAAAAITMAAQHAGAQTATAGVRGYVRGSAGAPVADAQVSARDLSTNQIRSTTSGPDGFYYMGGLRPGRYEITARHLGVAPQTRTVDLFVGQTTNLDFSTTEVAARLSAVEVRAAATGTDVRSSEVGTNVSRQEINNLPNFERNFLDIARLAPGITPQAVNNTDKFIAAGGQPAEAVNVFVDGATYKNDVLRGGVVGQDASKGNPFPQGAVQEFRIITQNYKAEYQKAASAIITATTRTGSNQWEGDLFAYGIGNSYVAKDAAAVRRGDPRPNFKRLQTGGSLGGPIVRDKLFFFGTYELNARDEPAYVTLGGNASKAPAGLNPQQYTGQFTSQFREHLGFGKLTWVQSGRSTVDASVNVRRETDFRGFGGQTSYQSAENVRINVYTGVANWRYAGDKWLNEAQVNAQQFIWNPMPLNPGIVGKNYFGIIRIGGRDTRQQFTQNRLSLRDDITHSVIHLAGDHVVKGGASIDFLKYESIKDFVSNPIFDFRTDENYSRPFEALFGFGNPRIATNNTQIGAYIQDDWNVTPRLTVNLGLRWDVETNMINNSYVTPLPLADSLRGPLNANLYFNQPAVINGRDTVIRRRIVDELGGLNRFITRGRKDRPMYLGAWQPRLGFSYDVSGNSSTVIFGGAGIYYDRNYWNTLLDEQFRRQFKVLRVAFNDSGPTSTCPLCAKWDPKYYDPAQLRTLSGTAGLPEVFLVANDLKPPKTYQMSLGLRHVFGSVLTSISYNGIRGFNGMNFVHGSNWGGLAPTYAQLWVTDDRVKTRFDAMELQIQRPMTASSWWGGSLAYTLSRAEEQGQSTDMFWPWDDAHPTVGELPWRRAPGNQTHTIVAYGITRLPYDVRFSTIVNLGSGLTVNATDASRGWSPTQQRTYIWQPPTRPFLGLGHVFNTQNIDARLEKDFPLSSGQHVGVVAEVFNALNSANFGCYDVTIFPTTGSPNANYGKANCAAPGRRLQVGLRYGFGGSSSNAGLAQ